MTFLDDLEKLSSDNPLTQKKWKGTFRDFLKLIESKEFANIGALAHERIYNMIIDGGVNKKDYFGTDRTSYNFFEDSLFGIEDSIDHVMMYIHSAAQKTETSRRMLLMYGPPSGGKTTLTQILKRGLEKYSQTTAGAVFALANSQMHENPFLLIPHEMREKFEKTYNIKIEGDLSPASQYYLQHTLNGNFMEYPIEQIFLSEKFRIGVGTFLPSDTKCLTGNCSILTDRGIMTGSSLFNMIASNTFDRPQVWTGNSFAAIKNCYDNGIKPVYEISLCGLTIEATSLHRFKTINTNGEFEFTRVSDMLGKSVPVMIGTNIFGNQTALRHLPFSAYTNKYMQGNIPQSLTPDLARLVGVLVGSGLICDDKLVFDCVSHDKRSGHDLLNLTVQMFGDVAKFRHTSSFRSASRCPQIEIDISFKCLIDFINLNFGINTSPSEREIPECILSSTKECQIQFIEGLLSCDFYADVNNDTEEIACFSQSKKLISQLQIMLINMGMYSYISIDHSAYRNRLSLFGEDARMFVELFHQFRNQHDVHFATDSPNKSHSFESFGSLTGLIDQIKEFVPDFSKLVNCQYAFGDINRCSPTRQDLIQWRNYLADYKLWRDPRHKSSILHILDNLLSVRSLPVLGIRYIGNQNVYDIEVGDLTHTFIVNGIPSHNSQDQSELVGGIDFSRIQEFGDEADPRSYNFNGELNVANRGMMDFIEILKCCTAHTRIPTSKGLLKIADIHGNGREKLVANEILLEVPNGFSDGVITRSCYKGQEECLKIETSRGYSIEASKYHRLMVMDPVNGIVWKAMKDLSLSDTLVMSCASKWSNTTPELPQDINDQLPDYHCHDRVQGDKPIQIPTHINKNIARLLGYFMANGSHLVGDGYKKCGIKITNNNLHVLNDVLDIADSLGLGCSCCKNEEIIFVHSRSLCVLFECLGLDDVSSDNKKFIPEIIFSSPKDIAAAFVSAYFDACGTVENDAFYAISASKQFSSEIQLLLLNFGIVSSLQPLLDDRGFAFKYEIVLTSPYYDKFMTNIGCASPINRLKEMYQQGIDITTQLPDIARCSPIFVDDVFEITDIGRQDVFDVHETTSNAYSAHGFINHNSDEKFLRVLLTVTEEKSIKAPRFGLIYVDCFVVGHSNEQEFRNFMNEKKYEAYHDRMVIVKVPYNLSISNEVKIYNKLLSKSDAQDIHIAPNTLLAAAMFAVLTRLDPNEVDDLTLIKKMKLYDSQEVTGFKLREVPDIKKRSPREGMSGVSPRFIIDQICAAISKAKEEERDYITALDVLRQLNAAVNYRDTFTAEQKNAYASLLEHARREWNDLLRNDIQKAFFLEFANEAKALCDNYLEQIQFACDNEKPKDPITGEPVEVNEKLLRSIEDKIEISSSGREDFRNEILRAVAAAANKDKRFDYTQHAYLREAIQKKLFEERRGVIQMTVTSRNPDREQLKRINEVIGRMVEQQGYSELAANALLKYASAHLFDK